MPLPTVHLHDASGRPLGHMPLAQADLLAASTGHALQLDGTDAHLTLHPAKQPRPLAQQVVEAYPAPIALCLRRTLAELHPFTRLHRLIDTFEATIELVAVVALQEVVDQGAPPKVLANHLLARLPRPLTSAWIELYAACRQARDPSMPALLDGLETNSWRALCQPLTRLRNLTAHGAVPHDDVCTKRFIEALPWLTALLEELRPLADLCMVQVGPHASRLLRGATPGRWGEGPQPVGIRAGHVVIGPEPGPWLDLHPLVLVDGDDVSTLLPVFQYAGLTRRTVEFLAHHAGHRVGRPDLRDEVVIRYVPGWKGGAADAPVADLSTLFEHYGKYELLRLAARGVLKLRALSDALKRQPDVAVELVEAMLVSADRLQAELEDTRQALAAAEWLQPDGDGLSPPGSVSVVSGSVRALPSLTRQAATRPPPRVFGRQALVAQVAIQVKTQPLVTLVGLGGIGKTTVARTALAELHDAFADGVWLVDAKGAQSLLELAERVWGELGLPFQDTPPQALASELAQAIGGRRVLLALDNIEPLLVADGVALRTFLSVLVEDRRAPHLLLTSRQATGLDREVQVPLPPLSDDAAARLVRDIAATASPDDRAHAVRACDGHPLALELWGHGLALGKAHADQHTRTGLAATLDRSWEALDAASRVLVGAAALLPGGVPRWLAVALDLGDPLACAARTQGLVQAQGARLCAHELVRADAQARGIASDLWATLVTAHVGAAETWRQRYNTGESAAARSWFTQELPNLQAVLRHATPAQAVGLFEHAWLLFLWTGRSATGLRAARALLTDLPPGLERGQVAYQAATMAYFVGRHQEGSELAELAIPDLPAGLRHRGRYIRSTTLRGMGLLDEAEAEMRRAAAGALSSGDLRSHANCLKELGVIADIQGQPDQALAQLQAAVDRYLSEGMDIERGFAVKTMGLAAWHQGDLAGAAAHAEAALALGRRIDEPRVQGYALVLLAELHLDAGAWGLAQDALVQAGVLWRRADHRSGMVRLDVLQAQVSAAVGHTADAWRALEAAASDERADPGTVAQARLLQARLAQQGGRPWLQTALAGGVKRHATRAGDVRLELQAAALLGEACADRWRALGDGRRAARAALRHCDDATAMGSYLEATATADRRTELLALMQLARHDLVWAAQAHELSIAHGTAHERGWTDALVAAATLAERPDQLTAVLALRRAAEGLLRAGDLAGLRWCLSRLAPRSPQETELLTFLSAQEPADLLRDWDQPELAAGVLRWRPLLRIADPPAVLVERLQEGCGAPLGEDGLRDLVGLVVGRMLGP